MANRQGFSPTVVRGDDWAMGNRTHAVARQAAEADDSLGLLIDDEEAWRKLVQLSQETSLAFLRDEPDLYEECG